MKLNEFASRHNDLTELIICQIAINSIAPGGLDEDEFDSKFHHVWDIMICLVDKTSMNPAVFTGSEELYASYVEAYNRLTMD